MRVVFANDKGGTGRTTCALLLTLGLVELNRHVVHVECKFGDVPTPSLPTEGLPFDYRHLTAETLGDLADQLWTLRAATPTSTDLVIDLPAMAVASSEDNYWLVEGVDVTLVPFRRGAAEVDAAMRTWQRVDVLSESHMHADCRPWLLPVAWPSSMRAMRELAAHPMMTSLPADFPSRLLPWSVPRLSPLQQNWLTNAERIGDVPVTTDAPQLLARAVLRLAAEPERPSFDVAALLGGPDGMDVDRLSGDVRPMSARLIDAGEDLGWLECGVRPTEADLAAAPTIEDWRIDWTRGFILKGFAVGHPSLDDGPVRTSMIVFHDKDNRFVRTLSRYYRLGRPASVNER